MVRATTNNGGNNSSPSNLMPSYQRCEDVPPPSNHTGTMNNNGNANDDRDNESKDSYQAIDIPSHSNGSFEDDEDDSASPRYSFSSSSSSSESKYNYNWRLYFPSTHNAWHYMRWFCVGGSYFAAPESDASLHRSLAGLAHCLTLLRQYKNVFGIPEKGGVQDREYVLREVTRDLYAGGAPLWALEPLMQKAAEGLSGQTNVNIQLFPRKAFIYSPSGQTTTMFPIQRGFNIRKMDSMEKVAVRLATFASNTQAVSNVPARFPHPSELFKVAQRESTRRFDGFSSKLNICADPKKLAKRILHLASKEQGLFYYINSREYGGNNQFTAIDEDNNDDDEQDKKSTNRRWPVLADFWIVTEEERDLFSRLACLEAMQTIDEIDKTQHKPNPWLFVAYRVCASAGACAFWFNGSWYDMIVAGILAVLIGSIGTLSILSKQERIIHEVVASFLVGMTASLFALTWPKDTCFASIAIAGVLNILQGFRVVCSIIEIMSKHTVSGGADLLEGILYTGLIAYFLRFGQYMAASIMGDPSKTEYVPCSNGIDKLWYLLFVPLAAMSWSGLFNPTSNRDLVLMTLHGTLAYGVNYSLSKAGANVELNYFVSASVVSLSAGIVSRFTGRQALGNTVAGIYVLLPGAYLVRSLYSTTIDGSFFIDVIRRSMIIGIGGWTGTILCSPTLFGTTRGLLWQSQGLRPSLRQSTSNNGRHRDDSIRDGNQCKPATMLYF